LTVAVMAVSLVLRSTVACRIATLQFVTKYKARTHVSGFVGFI